MLRGAETMATAFPSARLRRLDGHVELAVAESAGAVGSRPSRVTAIIAALYREIGGEPVTAVTARRISAAGREWLLQRAARRFFGAAQWYETVCDSCGASFDLQLSLDAIPHAEPGPGYPVAKVMTSIGQRLFEVPNGRHEEAYAAAGGKDARRVFAALCGLSADAEAEAIRFDEVDLLRIDAGLEAVSPEIADGVDVVCPDCGIHGHARVDPLGFAFPNVGDVLGEVHTIAAAYHWSEEAILDLPLPRRRAYVELIRAGRPSASSRGRWRP